MSLLRAAGCKLRSRGLCGNAASVFSVLSYNASKAAKFPNCQILPDFSPFLLPHWSHAVLFAETIKRLFPTSALDIVNLAPISWNFLANSHGRLAPQPFPLVLQTESLGQAVKWTRNCPLHLFLSGPLKPHIKLFFSVFIFHLALTNGYWSWVVSGWVLPAKPTNVSWVTFILVI